MRLWYRQPAKAWNEALPVGNGRLGAMVFGDPAEERIQLNEETLWSGGQQKPSRRSAASSSRVSLPKLTTCSAGR
jgi:alpha-L-fucosidase 2